MKLALVCNEYPPGPHGGIGTMTRVLGRALAAAGHEVRSIGVYPRDYPAPDYEDDQGVRVWRLRQPSARMGWMLARYRLFQAVARWARRGEIDLIEVPDWEGWAAGWPRLPVPVVVRLHGSASYFRAELGRPPHRTLFRLERASLRRADAWCSVSQYTAERTRALFQMKTGPGAILYNPVEIAERSIDVPRSRNRIVFSGTLTAKKGVRSLLRAWPLIAERCPWAELHLIGKDGRTEEGSSMRDHLFGQLDESARGRVHFHGHLPRETLFEALATARAAVFPSYAEAFAIAPLEAMASGCPTVFTHRGSGPELIEHGVHGLLIDPDRPEEIAGAVVRLLSDDALAERLGQAGRARVASEFSLGCLAAQNIAYYQDRIRAFARPTVARSAISR